MKKTYQQPSLTEVIINTTQLMAGSLQSLTDDGGEIGLPGTGEDATTGDDALARGFGELWDL